MAWLTTLDNSKRITRERRSDVIYSYVQSGSLTPGSSTGGLTWTQTRVGLRTITTYEYPGINQANGPTLADGLTGTTGVKECYFSYGEAGAGSVWLVIEVLVMDP